MNYEEALEEVKQKLKGEKFEELKEYYRNKYKFSLDLELWKISTKIIDAEDKMIPVELWVQFPKDFPWVFPKIFISQKNYSDFKYAPHVESDKKICLFNNQAQPNSNLPHRVLKEALNRARSILEDGLRPVAVSVYEEEFESYWSQTYSSKDQVLNNTLIISEQELKAISGLLVLTKPIGGIRYIVHQSESSIENFKSFLNLHAIKFRDHEVYVFDDLPFFGKPPYHFSNRKLASLLKDWNEDEYKRFMNFYNSHQEPKIFLFKKTIESQIRYFGWSHSIPLSSSGNKKKDIRYKFKQLCEKAPFELIKRIYPQVYSINRLIKRSSGKEGEDHKNGYAVAGLGSIGSNLIHFLDGINVSWKLIDQEILTIENTGRHLLGFQYIYKYKTEALQNYLITKHPLRKIAFQTSSVMQVINQNPDFINNEDALLVCIGEYTKEKFIAEALANKVIIKPVFFIWVEPYLMAGHCVYLNPEQPDYDEFHIEGRFKYNLIKDYSNDLLSMQEAGCQSIYTPYANNDILYFLGSLIPRLKIILKDPLGHSSQSYSWVGDLSIAEELGIELHKPPSEFHYGQIIEHKL